LRVAAAAGGELSLPNGAIRHQLAPSHGHGPARFASRQRRDLRPKRDAFDRRRHATARHRALTMEIDFPFHFDSRGRTAATDETDHIRDMIEQLIFTNPGERVNRPDFGSGLLQLVFAPNSPELAATVQFTVQAALQRWLGDVIELREIETRAVDSSLTLDLRYAIRRTNEEQTATFTRSV
jgi:uncharacterized protein